MTVVSTKDRRKIVPNTGVDPFINPIAFDQYVASSTYIKVYADTTEMSVGTHYSLSGIGSLSGIEVTITSEGLALDPDRWVVLYAPPMSQDADLSVGGTFGAAYESALDNLLRRMQALEDRTDRAVKTSVDDLEDAPHIRAFERAEGTTLVFDEDGNLTEGAHQGEIEGAAAAAASAAASAAAALASEQAVEDGLEVLEAQIETIVPNKLAFEGDGVTTNFLLGRDANEVTCDVYISGVWQNNDQWSLTGSGLTTELVFATAPAAPINPGEPNINVKLGAQASVPAGLLGPDSVAESNIQDDAVATGKIPDEAVTLPKLAPEVVDLIEAGGVNTLATLATLAAADVATTEFIRTAGRATLGDGGGMLMRNIGASTPAAGYPATVSADGSNWEFVPTEWSVTFEQFGAVGDGTTDDLTACQAAVDFIYARGGGVIRLGWNKVYALSGLLRVWQRVRLVGVSGAWMNQYSTGVGSAAPVPLGSAFFGIAGMNTDLVGFQFNVYNDAGTIRETGNNRVVSDWRHHGGATDVCFWQNRSGVGTPPTSVTRQTGGSACTVWGARYVWLDKCAGMFAFDHGFDFRARNYTADIGAGGTVGSNNQRLRSCNGHQNAKNGFLVAMYDSIVTGNDAGNNGLDGFAGYFGQLMSGNAAWNNLRRGFNLGVDSGYISTSATSTVFTGNNAYDNEWDGFRISGNGAAIAVGCYARGNGRDTGTAVTNRCNYVITSTARSGGFVGCQSVAWDYDGVTPTNSYGFLVSNPTYKIAFCGNSDRGSPTPSSISTPANIIAPGSVS